MQACYRRFPFEAKQFGAVDEAAALDNAEAANTGRQRFAINSTRIPRESECQSRGPRDRTNPFDLFGRIQCHKGGFHRPATKILIISGRPSDGVSYCLVRPVGRFWIDVGGRDLQRTGARSETCAFAAEGPLGGITVALGREVACLHPVVRARFGQGK